MPKETEWCADPECGCQITRFVTTKECPTCGEQLRLSGHSQSVNFRLTCQYCGYHSPLLPPEKLQVLL